MQDSSHNTFGEVQESTVISNITGELWAFLPPKEFPYGLKSHEYMWQYKVSKDVYNRLLSLINTLQFSNKKILVTDIEGYHKGSTNIARIIALLISEWYKRESPGLDGDGALDIFVFREIITAKDIWDAAGFGDNLLHKAKKSNLRQTAMCVLGGFPLVYVNAADNRFETLINKLSEDDEEEDDTHGSWDELFDDNNTVFSGSLRTGSCKMYVDALWNYMESEDLTCLPFCEDDLQDNEFKRFCTLLKNGYGEKLQKDFFKETYSVYTTDDDYALQTQLKVQIGFKKDNHILYASQLEKINLGMNTASVDKLAFFLKAVYSDGSTQHSSVRYYRRVGNGKNDFVSVGLSPLSIDYDLFNIERIDFLAKDIRNNVETRLRSFRIDSYLELYESPVAYCWTSQIKSSARKALLLDGAVFQDIPSLSPIEKRSDELNSERPLWNWLYLNETITLRSVDGEPYSFKCGNAQPVRVSFSYSSVEKTIKLRDGHLEFVTPEQQGLIRLLYGVLDSRGRNLNFSVQSKRPVYLEFKENDSYRYQEWTDNSAPSQGFISIRISTNESDRIPFVSDVYYIPSKSPVERNLDEHLITFDGINAISICDRETHVFTPIEDAVYKDTVPDKSAVNVSDAMVFRVGNESAYVNIEVFRAFRMQELIKDGKPKRSITGDKRYVPVILHNHFKIRTINESGCQITYLDRLTGLVYSAFSDGFLSSPSRLCDTLSINPAVEVYVYKDMTVDGTSLKFKVSRNHQDDYRFFFWSGKRDDVPVPIESFYDDESGIMTLDCASCRADRGVVFQSLKDCSPYNYYRPFYIRTGGRLNAGIPPFYSTPSCRFVYGTDDILISYNLYRDHRTYAAVFSPLAELRNNPEWQREVLEYALKQDGYVFAKEDILQLNRLCAEIGFDWILLPRKTILDIITRSEAQKTDCIQSLRGLFSNSLLVKENDGNNRHEQYYFKRIFIENDDFFNNNISFDGIFSPTKYRARIDARTIVDYWKGEKRYFGEEVLDFIKKISSYQEYIFLFRDVFYQYVIKQ